MRTEPIVNSAESVAEDPGWQMQQDPERSMRRKLISGLLSILILAAGLAGAKYLMTSVPKTNKQPPARMAPLVQVQTVFPATQPVIISAMGIVIPARKIVLKTRVSGEVIGVHPDFIEGGFLSKGSQILQIDDADYKLARIKKESAVSSARFAIELEQGRQTVARREWSLLQEQATTINESADLALRIPHLEKVRSDLAAAQADLAQAELDLVRTRVIAPFNAIVQKRHVAAGSQVTASEPLADLVDTDEYWIRVSLPVDQLRWISIPQDPSQKGAPAQVHYHGTHPRAGVITALLSDLEPEGRLARLVVSVSDPLGRRRRAQSFSPLLIGEYVRVEITGQQIEDAYRIPRTAFRNNNRLWVAGKNDTLEIRPVQPVWRDADTVILSTGLSPGERLITSDISVPVAGMPVTIETPQPPPKTPGKR